MGYKILHIAVHLGGGIGTVLTNWIKKDTKNEHTILCLSRTYYNNYNDKNIHENMRANPELSDWIEKSDIVIIHFWNHPLLFDFLINENIPKCRLCFWSHVSGLNPPYVFSEKLINFADRFIFSSPISYEAAEIKKMRAMVSLKLGFIWTTGDISEFLKIEKIPHDTFNVGCIGTLDCSKLHPDFVEMCAGIDIPNVKFIMVGGGCDADKIKRQVKDRGMEDKFLFTGVVKDVKPYLAIMDVFGYPLNPQHYGTCEQVLGEAMAAAVIPIVMNNPAENHILRSLYPWSVCDSEKEYIRGIKFVYKCCNRPEFIEDVRDSSKEMYNIRHMVNEWNRDFWLLMKYEKTAKGWPADYTRNTQTGHGIFMESLGDYGKILEAGNPADIRAMFQTNQQWKSKSKGSVLQYLQAFPDDKKLQEWSELL